MSQEDLGVKLIAEQMAHALDLQKAEIQAQKVQQDHDRQINELKFEMLKKSDEAQATRANDFENRIRDVTAGVIQSRFFIGLVGASLLIAIASMIKAFFF
jgi:hypothetical protein